MADRVDCSPAMTSHSHYLDDTPSRVDGLFLASCQVSVELTLTLLHYEEYMMTVYVFMCTCVQLPSPPDATNT